MAEPKGGFAVFQIAAGWLLAIAALVFIWKLSMRLIDAVLSLF